MVWKKTITSSYMASRIYIFTVIIIFSLVLFICFHAIDHFKAISHNGKYPLLIRDNFGQHLKYENQFSILCDPLPVQPNNSLTQEFTQKHELHGFADRKELEETKAKKMADWAAEVGKCKATQDNILCATSVTVQRYSPLRFIPNTRTPCVFIISQEDGTGGKMKVASSEPPKATKGHQEMQCLPAVYLMGFMKCGTTNLHDILRRHQSILQGERKEIDWWRGGRPYECHYWQRNKIDANVYTYMKLFQKATKSIEQDIVTHRNEKSTYASSSDLLILESTPSNRRGNTVERIKHLNPKAKLIYMMRDPVERTLSDYRYRFEIDADNYPDQSPQGFHQYVTQNLNNESLANEHVPLGGSVYADHIKLVLSLYDRKDILFLKFEDFAKEPLRYIEQFVLPFLKLPPFDETIKNEITHTETKTWTSMKQYNMPEETRILLQKTYRPFNNRLADLLGDERWKWGY